MHVGVFYLCVDVGNAYAQEEYAKEREELLAGQRAEMQQKFDALVQGWAQELAKSNPKMFDEIKGGCKHVIKEGMCMYVWVASSVGCFFR